MIKAQHSYKKGLLERTYREKTSSIRTHIGKDSMVRKGLYIKGLPGFIQEDTA